MFGQMYAEYRFLEFEKLPDFDRINLILIFLIV